MELIARTNLHGFFAGENQAKVPLSELQLVMHSWRIVPIAKPRPLKLQFYEDYNYVCLIYATCLDGM